VDATSRLEARVHLLEKSRDRSRRIAWAASLLLAVLTLAALVPQAVPEIRTGRVILTRPDSGHVVLVAGPESSLILEKPDGSEIARFGGRVIRPAR
jgi:hypothetical protein